MYRSFPLGLTLHAGISLLLQHLAPAATFYVSMDFIKHPERVNYVNICCPFLVHFVTVMCRVSYPCTKALYKNCVLSHKMEWNPERYSASEFHEAEG